MICSGYQLSCHWIIKLGN